MQKLLLTALFLFSCSLLMAQAKKTGWYKNYRIGGSVALLKGTADEYTTIAAFADAGWNAGHNFLLGAGAGFINFQNDKRASVVCVYAEKSTDGKRSKLFVFAKPGLAFAYKPLMQLKYIDRFEYWKKRPGIYFETGAGIRWMVGRHSFFISTGFSKTTYALFTKEYPVPVDPYDPFVEDAIVHQYKFGFSKLIFSMGFTF